MELEDVDVIGAQLPERVVEARHRTLGSRAALAVGDPGFGGDHHTVARNSLDCLADHVLCPVNGGGVEQIDPQIQRLMDQRYGLGFAHTGAEPKPAEAGATEPGDADPETGAA